ncbi:ABC transporter ATP-binding protein [Agarivorans sp. QJM3NY_29]|uniref:ABC transporter ATP-binding protein n=1 Tax=unclassified Agarivorans TaxID=2636026 RepID=UPI003D7D982C
MTKFRFLLQYSGASCRQFWLGIIGKMLAELVPVVLWSLLFIFLLQGMTLPLYVLFLFAIGLIALQFVIGQTAKKSFIGAYHITHQLRERLLNDLRKQPLACLVGKGLGERMKQITTDLKLFEDILSHLVADFLAAGVAPFAMLIMLSWISPILAVLLVVMIVLASTVLLLLEKRFNQTAQHYHLHSNQTADKLLEYIACLPMLKSFGNARKLAIPLNDEIEQVRKSGLALEATGGKGLRAACILLELALPLVMWQGARMVDIGTLTATQWLVAVAATIACIKPLTRMAFFSAMLRYFVNAVFRLYALANTPLQQQHGQALTSYELELDAVSLHLNQQTILDAISMKVAAGEHVAIVGPSGAGKSSLLDLIAAFHMPSQGTIRIGGLSLEQSGTEHLYRNIAYVTQDVQLFAGSLKDNLLIAAPDASEQSMQQAIVAAGLAPMLQRLPKGLESEVGENGNQFSQGERQRISIARAILHDAPILLLDEISSALDINTQAQVMAALKQLSIQKTVITVAHRLDTVLDSDRIYLLEKGQISHVGQHEALLCSSSSYQQLWKANCSGYETAVGI